MQIRDSNLREIKSYIEEKQGFKVSSLYIGQIKDKVGIKERKNYNIGSGDGKVPECPPDKEAAIMDALRHFRLIKNRCDYAKKNKTSDSRR